MSKEMYKPIPEFEGIYEVSNLGNIRRILPYKNTYKNKVLKQSKSPRYMVVTLSKDNIKKSCKVHIIVAKTFLGKKKCNDLVINHKDGDRYNNNVYNLEYVTQEKNVHHAIKIGTHKIYRSKKTGRFVHKKS